MTQEKFEQIMNVLKPMPPILYPSALVDYASKHASENIPPVELREIIYAALSLASGRIHTELDMQTFIKDAIQALEQSSEAKGLTLDKLVLTERLEQLLGCEVIAISTKASALFFSYERHATGCQILTDVRPVFGDDPTSAPLAAIIVHSLKIQYHEDQDTAREFYVSIDAGDLKALRDASDRALAKAESLQAILQTAQIKGIAPEEVRGD